MKQGRRIKNGIAAILAAATMSASESKADDFIPETDNAATFSLSAGYQDNNIDQGGDDFTQGQQIRVEGSSAVTFYPGAQLVTRGFLELDSLNYSDGNGENLVIDAGISELWEWARRAETYALNLGAGADFDCRYETGNYLEVPIVKTICAAGPMIDFMVDSEYVNFGLSYALGFGAMGNNVQGYNDLIKHKLRLSMGFHLGLLDLESYVLGEYNAAMQGDISRENLFLYLGANARLWIQKNVAFQFGYEYLWAYGDVDNVDSNTGRFGFAARF